MGTSSIDLAGSFDQIGVIYSRIPSGRLVILGPGGAGKTMLAVRLLLALLAARTSGQPVPVIFTASSWTPGNSLVDWLASMLERDYPGLGARDAGGATLAAELVNHRKILPIIDGLDEIGPRLCREAIRELNAFADLPIIITSRTLEYEEAVQTAGVITASAAIELETLTLEDLSEYLPRTTPPALVSRPGQWEQVVDYLSRCPSDPGAQALHRTLSRPFMVFLSRTVYSDASGKRPTELLDVGRDEGHRGIEAHLLASYLPAVYSSRPPTAFRWRPDQVRYWLANLARHLETQNTSDFAWWQLRRAIPPLARAGLLGVASAIMAALASGLTVGIVFGFLRQPAHGLVAGLTAALVVGGLEGLVGGLVAAVTKGAVPTRTEFLFRGWPRNLAYLTMSGLVAGILATPRFGPVTGAGVAVVFGLASGLTVVLLTSQAVVSPDTVVSFASSLVNDRNSFMRKAFGLTIGGLLMTGFGQLGELTPPLTAGLVAAFIATVVVGLQSAWGEWVILARVWMPLTGRLPWRAMAFFADAYDRGVFRQRGAAFQFRHELLQHHLANASLERHEIQPVRSADVPNA